MNRNSYILLAATSLMAMAAYAAPKTGGSAPPVPPAPTSVNASGYKFEALAIPSGPSRGKAGAEPSKLGLALSEVPLDNSFLETVTVPDTITDAGERAKEFKALARKMTNKIGGAIRRYRKVAGNELHNFALRTVDDDTYGHGVRVWRVADTVVPPAPLAS